MTNRIVIKKANRIIDVFFGEEGFVQQEWVRFLLVGNYLKYVIGAQLSPQDFTEVKKLLGLSGTQQKKVTT